MGKVHVFLGHVLHSGKEFLKGQECPTELHSEMLAKKLIAPIAEAVVPVAAPVAKPRAAAVPKQSDQK